MTQQAMHPQLSGETGGPEELIPAGAVTFGLEYRLLHGGDEQGLCIHVYGNDMPGDDKELLRLDCFRIAPHYHYRNANVKQNIRLQPYDAVYVPNSTIADINTWVDLYIRKNIPFNFGVRLALPI